MRIAFFLLSLVLISSMQLTGWSQSAVAPFSITIAADADAKSGAEITVKINVTNTSDHEISFLESNPECDYSAQVHEEGDGLAPDSEYKRHLVCNGTLRVGRRFLKRLKPGEFLSDSIIVSALYEMKQPGRYSVQVFRRVP